MIHGMHACPSSHFPQAAHGLKEHFCAITCQDNDSHCRTRYLLVTRLELTGGFLGADHRL